MNFADSRVKDARSGVKVEHSEVNVADSQADGADSRVNDADSQVNAGDSQVNAGHLQLTFAGSQTNGEDSQPNGEHLRPQAQDSQPNRKHSHLKIINSQETHENMRNTERRKLEKFEREQAFMTDNAADFPKDSPGDKAAKFETDIINEMRALAAQQSSGGATASRGIGGKDDALDLIMQMIRNMNRAANAFEDEIPGSNLLFRLPRNRSQQNILATARAFHADAVPLEAKFIEYGLEPTFLADLQALITAFDTAGSDADSGEEKRAAATGGLIDAARRGMTNSRKLDAIVRIKYQNNPQKLAAWTVASHLERPPKPRMPTP